MKKLLAIILSTLMLLSTNTVSYAKTGDVVGKIYSTDILTYVNGRLAEGYNIGGKTAIVIEDLRGYSIYHDYNDEERLLTVDGTWYENYMWPSEPDIKRGNPGKILGNIYDTDIKVILNGSEVKGYNIGGKTAILIEDIGTVTDNPNEKYGYSKYMCNFEWDGTERTVKLNFVDGYKVAYGTDPLAITVASISFTAKDNIWIADYNPLNEFFSNVYSSEFTNEYLADTYVLKPLYFEIDGEKYQVGLCYTTSNGYDENFISDPEYADELLKKIVPEPVAADEAVALLSDGENYEILDSIETEDFFFLVVLDREKEDPYNNIHYIAVKKTGGYAKINGSSTMYTTRELKKIGINEVRVTVSPFAAPGGPSKMSMEFNLNNYIFWK